MFLSACCSHPSTCSLPGLPDPGEPLTCPPFSLPSTPCSIRNQYEFMIQRMGGPPLYSQRKGHPALMARHSQFPCTEATAERWGPAPPDAKAAAALSCPSWHCCPLHKCQLKCLSAEGGEGCPRRCCCWLLEIQLQCGAPTCPLFAYALVPPTVA